MADDIEVTTQQVADCAPEKCATCLVTEHAKRLCAAYTQFKREVGALHEQNTPEARALVDAEIRCLVAMTFTWAAETGYYHYGGNLVAMMRGWAEVVQKVVEAMDPGATKRALGKLIVSIIDQRNHDRVPPTDGKVH